jgi:hypothetical protein
VDGTDPQQHEQWLRGVYTDEVPTVQLTPRPDLAHRAGAPTSSSSMPTVMAGMRSRASVVVHPAAGDDENQETSPWTPGGSPLRGPALSIFDSVSDLDLGWEPAPGAWLSRR